MPHDHSLKNLQNSPADVILDVLSNGRVRSVFSHQSLAQQILHCFAVCGIEVSTAHERRAQREADEAAPKPRRPLESLRYSIETWATGGNELLEVLGRETLATPATAAYRA